VLDFISSRYPRETCIWSGKGKGGLGTRGLQKRKREEGRSLAIHDERYPSTKLYT